MREAEQPNPAPSLTRDTLHTPAPQDASRRDTALAGALGERGRRGRGRAPPHVREDGAVDTHGTHHPTAESRRTRCPGRGGTLSVERRADCAARGRCTDARGPLLLGGLRSGKAYLVGVTSRAGCLFSR